MSNQTDFVVGHTYPTRSGGPARIYAIDGGGEFCIHGAYLLNGLWLMRSWTKEGLCAPYPGSAEDLIPPEDTKIETNIYEDLNIPDDMMTLPYSRDVVEFGLKIKATPYIHRCALRMLRLLIINQEFEPSKAYAKVSRFMSDYRSVT